MIDFVQNTIDGVMIGSSYALLALGFTLIFGVMRRLNLSYGPSIMIGAYLGTLLYVQLRRRPAGGRWRRRRSLGAVLAGVYVERLCFAPMAAGAGIASMVSSFAIWMQLEQAAILVLPRHTYPFPPLATGAPLTLGPFLLRVDHLIMLGCALALAAGVQLAALPLALRPGAARDHRQSGRRASRRHQRQAAVMLAFALASAVGGIAGYLVLAADQQVTPMFGMWATFKGLIAMMIGGLGSIPGAIARRARARHRRGAQPMVFRPADPRSRRLPAAVRLPRAAAGRAARRAAAREPALGRRRREMDDYLVGVLSNIGVISFVALSAYLLLLTGEISFGQQAFFAIGAYAAGIATALWGWPLGAALVWGPRRGGGAAVLVGLPTLRLHGLYFAIATLAFAEMVRHPVRAVPLPGGDRRRAGRAERRRWLPRHPLHLRERHRARCNSCG